MDKSPRVKPSKKKTSQVENAKGKGKLVTKPKVNGKVAKKGNTPLVIHDGDKRRKKSRVISESDEDESENERELEEEKQLAKTSKKKKMTREDYKIALRTRFEVQVRWGDSDLLERLGLLFDVRMILDNIGLRKVLDMDHDVHYSSVVDLMASFEFKLNKDEDRTIGNLGVVDYMIGERHYAYRIREICTLYGFKPTTGLEFDYDYVSDGKVWSMIGSGRYTPGATKSALIKSPVLRFVHKFLANTLFARMDTDRINRDEMALLVNGLYPFFKKEFAEQRIVAYENINLGVILVNSIMENRFWAISEKGKKRGLCFGGMLTPLLLAPNVPICPPSTCAKQKIDESYLVKVGFLGKSIGERMVYKFTSPSLGACKVFLPNTSITRLNVGDLDNLRFAKGEEARIQGEIPFEPVEEGESSINHDDIPLGSPRYYHSSFKGKASSKSVEHALEGVAKNQRWNKWNTRSLHKLKKGYKKKVKALENQMSSLKDQLSDFKTMFETYVLRKHSPPSFLPSEDVFEEGLVEARRHSISHMPSSSRLCLEAPRPSSHERSSSTRKRRHIPSPSPPNSDNPSLHLSDSNSE